VTVTRCILGNATDPSVTVMVASVQVLTVEGTSQNRASGKSIDILGWMGEGVEVVRGRSIVVRWVMVVGERKSGASHCHIAFRNL
jgi:hypothetical protein